MDVDPTINRLRAQLTNLRQVGGAADLDAALAGAVAVPAVFVVPLAESGSSNTLVGGLSQRVQQEVGVLQVVANRRDATGQAALADLSALRLAVRQAMVGWVPDPANGERYEYRAGRLIRMDGDGRLWWIDQFVVNTYYRA